MDEALHLLTPQEIGQYSRPISRNMDEATLLAYIAESEDLDIKPAIGAHFFAFLLSSLDEEPTQLLLNGGRWTETDDSTFDETFEEEECCPKLNRFRYFAGLKKAIAYYTQARIIKGNDNQVTRFGLVAKDGEYSHRPTPAERSETYRDYCSMGDAYLADALDWLKAHEYYFPAFFGKGRRVTNNRTKVEVIGD